jgi:profilin|mmetsp:Transcript_5346/g.9629  ORF Transcript_5346/g.9629 Transcript_5346/m.9629 type:complete len:135 (-) Transcript_5346:316-720(-)
MSWQAYVDDHLLGELPNGGEVTKAAIFSHEGDLWAGSPGFPTIEEADFVHMMKAYEDNTKGEVAASGIKVAGEKYMFVRSDDQALLARQGQAWGFTAHKTGLAVLIAIYNEECQPADVEVRISTLADYLRTNAY